MEFLTFLRRRFLFIETVTQTRYINMFSDSVYLSVFATLGVMNKCIQNGKEDTPLFSIVNDVT